MDVKSVTAFLIFVVISSRVSVRYMQLFLSGSDFDIFLLGSRRLLILDTSSRKELLVLTRAHVWNVVYFSSVVNETVIFPVTCYDCTWNRKNFTVSFVKYPRQVLSQLYVLELVFTHRNVSSSETFNFHPIPVREISPLTCALKYRQLAERGTQTTRAGCLSTVRTSLYTEASGVICKCS